MSCAFSLKLNLDMLALIPWGNTVDGICAIQPFLVPGKTSAHVAPRDAFVATANVIRKCVGGTRAQGGQVRDFGEWRGLLICNLRGGGCLVDLADRDSFFFFFFFFQEASTISSSPCPSTMPFFVGGQCALFWKHGRGWDRGVLHWIGRPDGRLRRAQVLST